MVLLWFHVAQKLRLVSKMMDYDMESERRDQTSYTSSKVRNPHHETTKRANQIITLSSTKLQHVLSCKRSRRWRIRNLGRDQNEKQRRLKSVGRVLEGLWLEAPCAAVTR